MAIGDYVKKLAPPGDLPEGIIRWIGPASYTVVTPGATPSGGDSIPASLFGVSEILGIEFEGGFTGNFMVVPIRISAAKWTLQWRALNSNTVGGHAQTTGAEAVSATNLSAEYIRLRIVTRAA
jgi:hypothetical protein